MTLSWLLNRSSFARTITGHSERTKIADQAKEAALRDLDDKKRKIDREIFAASRMTKALNNSRERGGPRWTS